jgi:hypothetical protein
LWSQYTNPREATDGQYNQALEQIKTDPRGVIDSTIAATVCRELGLEWRHTPLTPPNTLALLLQQVLHGNVSNAELLDIAGLDLTEAAYCTAKGRLPLKVMREFSRRVCQAAASAAGSSGAGQWRGQWWAVESGPWSARIHPSSRLKRSWIRPDWPAEGYYRTRKVFVIAWGFKP